MEKAAWLFRTAGQCTPESLQTLSPLSLHVLGPGLALWGSFQGTIFGTAHPPSGSGGRPQTRHFSRIGL